VSEPASNPITLCSAQSGGFEVIGRAAFAPEKTSRMFFVVFWVRESTHPFGTPWSGVGVDRSRAQLQDIVPEANTHALLGA
jgi:hypothetical protein